MTAEFHGCAGPESVEAKIRFHKEVCSSYALDLTVGCSHGCVYCFFSALQKATAQREIKGYRGGVIVANLDKVLSQEKYPEQLYLSYATDPFAPLARDSAHRVLSHILPHGTQFLILTKGVIPDETIELLDAYGPQIAVQVGLTNLSPERNNHVEPGAASAQERLALLKKLNQTRVAVVAVRADPLFPLIDDTEEDFLPFLDAIAATGTRNMVISYVVAAQNIIARMRKLDYLRAASDMLTEETPTEAPTKVYSVPFDYKMKKLRELHASCGERGLKPVFCHCKDLRLGSSSLASVCHPRDSNEFVGDYTAPGNKARTADGKFPVSKRT